MMSLAKHGTGRPSRLSAHIPQTMRVARTYDIDDHRVESRPVPDLGPRDALIRVRACGLCGSDALDWYVRQKAPTVLGHEPVGEVVAVGPEVTAFRLGQRVFTHHHVPCGECHTCRRGFETNCERFRATALDPGGFAEFLRIPAENLEADTLALPDRMSDVEGTFIEPLACALRPFRRVTLTPEDTVAIVGLGVMGQLLVQVARARGAGRVAGLDFVESRRELAMRLGAHLALDPCQDAPARLWEATGGLGADLVIVGPGSPEAVDLGIALAGRGGTVVLFSPTEPARRLAVDGHGLYFRELTLTASYSCGPRETREALDLLASGAIRVEPLVTHRFGLEGLGEALRLARSKGEALKSLIVPGP
ncbi:MAG: alcohol dehydrogenase catalytic domain-containing protein [Planctomycetes bacterium]|nr:alcohol dehydrogenase catalytic domain-containing protein [Planctomycetota bacterium]